MKKIILVLLVILSISKASSIDFICYDGIIGINNEYVRNLHADKSLKEYTKHLDKTVYRMNEHLKSRTCKRYNHKKAKNAHLTKYPNIYGDVYDMFESYKNILKNAAERYKKEYGKDYHYIYMIHLNNIEK